MASQSFAINTEPHTADVGPHRFEFLPEVSGPAFAHAYAELRTVQSSAKDSKGEADLAAIDAALNKFVASFLLPKSVKDFKTAALPTRVLVQLTEWLVKLYAGSGDDTAGKSGD